MIDSKNKSQFAASSRLGAAIAAAAFVPTRQDLRNRARVAMAREIPESVVQGGLDQVRAYKACRAQVEQFAHTGRLPDRSAAALYRLEFMQGVRA